jgi:hypothetical protein
MPRRTGGAGDDRVSAGADGDAEAWGQAGDDVIRAGTQFTLHLYGGDGDDDIATETGTYGPSIIDGGPGRDRIDAPLAYGCCLDIVGQAGADTITAVAARSIDGGEGNDTISARAYQGIDGGTGNDTITGHGSIDGSWGNDTIDVAGNPGEVDVVRCGGGNDRVTADRSDTVTADCESVKLTGGDAGT